MKLTSKDFFLLLVILFSGRSLIIFNNALGLVLLFLLGLIIFRKQLATIKQAASPVAVWLVYVVLAYISVSSINLFFWFTYVAKIVLACLILSYYGVGVLKRIVELFYLLAIVSLVFWVWGALSTSSLFSFMSMVDIGGIYGGKGIGIFFIDHGSLDGGKRMFAFCNSGFCWEPGPYGAFLSLALFFSLTIRDQLKHPRRYLLVFILAIITTQSSTAYLCAMVVILFSIQFWIKNDVVRYILYPAIIMLGIVVFTAVPVLSEKITMEYESLERVDDIMDNAYAAGNTVSLGRFSSITFDYMTFKEYPLFGINGNPDLHILRKMYPDGSVAAINGWGDIISTYGIFGIISYLYLLISSALFWKRTYNYKGWFFFVLLYLIIGFSFAIIESPFLITILFASVFLKPNDGNNVLKVKSL